MILSIVFLVFGLKNKIDADNPGPWFICLVEILFEVVCFYFHFKS
jgi:hypothetical protein